MARVFLSHRSRDGEAASQMRQWLLDQGFEAPFLDFDKHSGIPPGANWEQVLYRELSASQALANPLSCLRGWCPQRRPLDSLALVLSMALGHRHGWRDLRDQIREALRLGRQHAWLTRLANHPRGEASANDASILLAIDQGEELFHQSEAEERQALTHPLSASLSEGMPYLAVMTRRSDALVDLRSAGERALAEPRPDASQLEAGVRSPLVLRNGDILTGGYNVGIKLWRETKQLGPTLLHGDAPWSPAWRN